MESSNKSVTELEIIFDDTEISSKYNKELINYFKNNLDILNRSGLFFIWKIATKDEYPMYKERGIKHYPALILPPNIMKYGVKDIIKEISVFINKRKKVVGNLNNGMMNVSDEALYEYQKRALGKAGDDDVDPQDGFDSSYRKKQSEMVKRRQMAGMEIPEAQSSNNYKVNIPNDNLDVDPSTSLQRLKGQAGTDSSDIDLMQMQLDKMDTSLGSMDYY
jgi:hypothetical protein